MLAPLLLDYKNPDYDSIYEQRINKLNRIRELAAKDDTFLILLKQWYAEHTAQFIDDWGVTFDPRQLERNLPATMPFILFPKQREWIDWLDHNWRNRLPGLTEKSRDCGASWVAVAWGCAKCLHHHGMVVGYGSRKEQYVDEVNQPKSLFFKARMFLDRLPDEFKGGWDRRHHAAHMRITFPETGSVLAGEAGDNIGRGDRASVYFVDESAFLERPQLVDASLSQTTNCRQDVSTPNGSANPFAQKIMAGKLRKFTFHWRDDPRKDEAWYQKQLNDLDEVVVAQEIDINYAASVTGVVIPMTWIMAAIGACEKLGIKPSGRRGGALDVADEGTDLNAFIGGHGVELQHLEEWSGKGGDIYQTVQRAFACCDGRGYPGFKYDADGLGAGVRGDARVINEQRAKGGVQEIKVQAFRGSSAVINPEGEDVRGRKNVDFFGNRKAQGWWSVRMGFQRTYRWITEGVRCNPDDIVSISPKIPLLTKLTVELSQPTYQLNKVGKVIIDKKPEGTRSPNLADAAMIYLADPAPDPTDVPLDVMGVMRAIESMAARGRLRRR